MTTFLCHLFWLTFHDFPGFSTGAIPLVFFCFFLDLLPNWSHYSKQQPTWLKCHSSQMLLHQLWLVLYSRDLLFHTWYFHSSFAGSDLSHLFWFLTLPFNHPHFQYCVQNKDLRVVLAYSDLAVDQQWYSVHVWRASLTYLVITLALFAGINHIPFSNYFANVLQDHHW